MYQSILLIEENIIQIVDILHLLVILMISIEIMIFSYFAIKKYTERKNAITKYILILFLGTFISFVLTLIGEFNKESNIDFAISILIGAIVNGAIIYLGSEIYINSQPTSKNIKSAMLLRKIFIVLNAILLIWLSTMAIIGADSLEARVPVFLIILDLMYFLGYLSYKSGSLSRKIDNPEHKKSLKYISKFAACYLSVYILLIIEFSVGDFYWIILDIFVQIYIGIVFYFAYRGFVYVPKAKINVVQEVKEIKTI